MQSTTPDVLVIGAGPTGMTAAIELRRAGLTVRIVDKALHLARWSQALVLQARTLEQFQRYGIAQQAVERGKPLHQARFFSNGKKLFEVDLSHIESRFNYVLFLPQSETEALLNETMEALGASTERGVELIHLERGASGVAARLRHSDGREEDVTPRWLLGCDGAHSKVRELTGIPFEGEGVDLHFILGDLELDGPDAPREALTIHFHHGGDVVFMGRLTDRLVRFIVVTHSGGEQPHDHRNLTLADFQQAADRFGVNVKITAAEWMTPFHVNDRQAAEYRSGNIFLAGDASHIHSPVGGQGMNTGIQDAANLCWKLAAVARGADDTLLNSYGEERMAVGRELIKRTGAGLKLATSPNALVEGLRDFVAPLATSLAPVQHAAMGFISEIALTYRDSSVVEDHGGHGSLRAGDRMPDVSIGGTTLLAAWHDSQPLAILVDPIQDQAAAVARDLPHARSVTVHSAGLDPAGKHLLGTGSTLFLLRPDGYIGLRAPLTNTAARTAYACLLALAAEADPN